MTPVKIALIGECMVELQESEPGMTKQTFGGDTLNTAIYCARLAKDLPVQVDYVTALGTDPFSERMIDFWEKEGVGSTLVQRQKGELPGLYYIELDAHGERIFHYWRGEAAAKKCFEYAHSDEVLRHLSEYDGIYLSGISLAILTPISREKLLNRLYELHEQGISIYFDCNYRPHLWSSVDLAREVYAKVYPLSRVVFLTVEEAEILLLESDSVKIHQKLQVAGSKESVIKDGGGMCSIFADGRLQEIPAQPVKEVVDTTAAGDSFSAVYLVARRFNCSSKDAAMMAHRTAAYVICHKGAIAPIEAMPITGLDIKSCS